MFPQIEDNLIDQLLEIKPTVKKDGNHVLVMNKLHYENNWVLWHQ